MTLSLNPLRFAAARVVQSTPMPPKDDRVFGFMQTYQLVDGKEAAVYEPTGFSSISKAIKALKEVIDQTRSTKVLSANGVHLEITPDTPEQEILDTYQAGMNAKLEAHHASQQ